MPTIATRQTAHKNKAHRTGRTNAFKVIAEPFLQDEGLPFANVLDATSVERIFDEEDALFAQDDIFSTEVVLWAFLAQCLRDGRAEKKL